MIAAQQRKAVFLLHQEGMGVRELSRRLGLSRKAVRRIIATKGEWPSGKRRDKHALDPELLRRLYDECSGWIQRVHEKLAEEHHVTVPYPTLTRTLRALGISTPREQRCARVPDEPGAEMQHECAKGN